MKISAVFLALTMSIFAAPSNATLIDFIYTGSGSGSINGSNFSNVNFVITAQSDTNDIQACGTTCNFINALSTNISIDGVGIFDFITETRTFSVNGIVGIARAGTRGLDLFNVFSSALNFDLASSLAAVTANAELTQWRSPAVNTSGGVLKFNNANIVGTFEAVMSGASIPTAVSAPATLALMVLGLFMFGLRRNKA
jgi:hypothetical protein